MASIEVIQSWHVGIIVTTAGIQQKTAIFLTTTVPISTLKQVHTLKCPKCCVSFCWLSICDNRTQVTKDRHLLRFWKRVDIFLVICIRVWFFVLVFRDNPLASCLHCTGGVHTSVRVCVWGGELATAFTHLSRGSPLTHVLCRTFVTGIKIESSEQSPFLRADQGIKVTSKLQKSKNQEQAAPIWPLTYKIKQSSTLFADQKSWSRS